MRTFWAWIAKRNDTLTVAVAHVEGRFGTVAGGQPFLAQSEQGALELARKAGAREVRLQVLIPLNPKLVEGLRARGYVERESIMQFYRTNSSSVHGFEKVIALPAR